MKCRSMNNAYVKQKNHKKSSHVHPQQSCIWKAKSGDGTSQGLPALSLIFSVLISNDNWVTEVRVQLKTKKTAKKMGKTTLLPNFVEIARANRKELIYFTYIHPTYAWPGPTPQRPSVIGFNKENESEREVLAWCNSGFFSHKPPNSLGAVLGLK